MYEVNPGLGGGALATGAVVALPSTGGNTLLTIVAITSIVVGTAIIVSTLVRAAAGKA
jgi:hypothetical protein